MNSALQLVASIGGCLLFLLILLGPKGTPPGMIRQLAAVTSLAGGIVAAALRAPT